jgi:hypothetical protein
MPFAATINICYKNAMMSINTSFLFAYFAEKKSLLE